MSLRSVSQRSASMRSQGSVLQKTAADTILRNDRTSGKNLGMTSGGVGTGVQKHEVVVTLDELQRIKDSCAVNKFDQTAARTMERKQLQEMSKQRVQNWPNTIEAVRRKREEDRIRKLEEEEIERRKIDAQEDALQTQLRTEALERANRVLYEQQDQVKAFQTKMLMADVEEERKFQQQIDKKKKQMAQNVEKQWQDLEKQQMEEYDQKVREKLRLEYEKKMKNQQDISNQLRDFKMGVIKRIQDEQLEGELIKRQVEQELEKEKEKERQRRLALEEQKQGFKVANSELRRIQEEEKLKELQHEQKIEEYAQKKLAMDKLRKDKEEQKFKEKQETRQRMIDKQIEYLSQLKNRDDEILNKQVADAEEKAHKLFMEKERRRLEMLQQIERSRQQQLDRKKAEKEADMKEQKEFSEFWKVRNEELAIAEQQEREEERQRQAQLKEFQRQQLQLKHKKAEEEFIEEQRAQLKTQALLDQQTKNFYSYAEKAIGEWEQGGKNVKPLVLELKGYKKKVV